MPKAKSTFRKNDLKRAISAVESTGARVSRVEIWEAIQSLVAKGYIRDSGQRRNGQIVWVATDKQPHPLEWREPEGSA